MNKGSVFGSMGERARVATVIGAIGLFASGLAAACSGAQEEPATPAAVETAAPPAPAEPVATNPVVDVPKEPAKPVEAPLTDGQIAAIVSAANHGEIDQAKLAQKQAKDAKVKKFAAMMIDHHGKNQADAEKLAKKNNIAPADSPISQKITADGGALIEKLKGEKGADFDGDYMAAQISQHQDVLDLFNNKLIPAAQNPELKGALSDFKPKVEQHLRDAKDIQAALPAKK